MIKAIFFDLDGTLLSFRTHALSPGTRQAFAALRRQGIHTLLATGRPPALIPDLQVPIDAHVTVNGGYCHVGGQVVLDSPIPPAESHQWLQYVEEHNIVTMLFNQKELYVNRISPEAQALQQQLSFAMPTLLPTRHMRAHTAYQYIAMLPATEDAAIEAMLPGCRLPRWHPAFSDLIPRQNSKAEGIAAVARHLHLRREELMAFGDGENDIEMLEYVGCGVAMGNATDTVKQHAAHVTTDVDHEGILQALLDLKVITL